MTYEEFMSDVVRVVEAAGAAIMILGAVAAFAGSVLGRRVTVSSSAGPAYEALAEAIADDGTLIVVRDSGERLAVHAADVSVRPR